MKTSWNITLGAVIALTCTTNQVAGAATTPQITSSVFAGGGGAGAAGGYAFTHALGEPMIGTASAHYSLLAGFLATDSTQANGPDLNLTGMPSPIVVTENIARDLALSVTNSGTATATNVQLNLNLPAGLRATGAGSSAGSCQITVSNVVCTVGTLAAGDSFNVRLTLFANVLPETAGEFENLADLSVAVTTDETDLNPADNALVLPVTVWLRLDWTDARGAFAVTQGENGPRHRYWPGYRLGALWDSEGTGVHSPLADWDDRQQMSDEDGVTFRGPIVAGTLATVVVNASFAGFLDAWADFNNDGDWIDTNEHVFASQPLRVGDNILSFNVPLSAAAGSITTRWRASPTGGLNFTGYGGKGEVEDHLMLVRTAPLPTLARSGGASIITFQTEMEANYVVEYSNSLTTPRWEVLTRLTGSGQPVAVVDNAPRPIRFYRVGVE